MDGDPFNNTDGIINSQTTAYALIGKPVHHSLSPLLYNTAFRSCGLNCCYLAFAVEPGSLSHALEGVRTLGFGGLNVTSPHKEAVIPFLQRISPEAELIQSVNTIVNRKGQLNGYSTDGPGFCRFLREDTQTKGASGEHVLIAGAGGAARAVAFSLAGEGVGSISIANRTVSRARELAGLIENNTPLKDVRALSLQEDDLQREMDRATVVINGLSFDAEPLKNVFSVYSRGSESCTGSGTGNGNDSYNSKEKEPGTLKGCTFVDLRYSPEDTTLMKLFRRGGGKAYNGKGMLLWQAVMAFELFTGNGAPTGEMRRAIKI